MALMGTALGQQPQLPPAQSPYTPSLEAYSVPAVTVPSAMPATAPSQRLSAFERLWLIACDRWLVVLLAIFLLMSGALVVPALREKPVTEEKIPPDSTPTTQPDPAPDLESTPAPPAPPEFPAIPSP